MNAMNSLQTFVFTDSSNIERAFLVPSFWRRLLKKKRKHKGEVLALGLFREGMSLAHVRIDGAGSANLADSGFYPCSESERARELSAHVGRMGLAGCTCRLVLAPADYSLVQTSAPDVPPAEMREALRWRIQDMIDFPVAEAEVEFFPMPASKQPERGNAVTAVVCRSSLIRTYSKLCQDAGLKLELIDIPELALRNLAARLPENERGVVLVYLESTRGSIVIQREGVIYISRELDIGFTRLEPLLGNEENDFSDGAIERLALEIQRSLDYYESYYGMPPVAGLVVAPLASHTQNLVDRLNQALGVIARAMDVGALLSCNNRLDDAEQQLCLTAIGVALRKEQGE